MDYEQHAREIAELAESLHAADGPVKTAEEVVAYACREVEADYGGITLIGRGGRLRTVAPSARVVAEVDVLQYALGEGPCRDASWEQQTLISQDLAIDRRWPRWGPKAADLGIGSALAVELTGADGRRIGAVNNYWTQPRIFSADDVAFASLFARHAALALANAMQLEGLNVALDGRKLIGQAQGILMERHGLDETHAFEVLRRYSQDHNLKLRQVAEYLVTTRNLPRSPGDSGPI